MNYRSIFFTCFLFLLSQLLYAQRDMLRISGKVRENKEKLSGVRISLLNEGEEISFQTTENSGKFLYKLPLQANYMLIFSKRGYRSKYVEVIAENIPEFDAAFGYEFGGLDVTLFKEIQGLNDELLDEPVAKIIYDTIQMKFIFDVKYFEEIQARVDSLQLAIEEQEKDEQELLALQEAAKQEQEREEEKLQEEREQALLREKQQAELKRKKELEEQKQEEDRKQEEARIEKEKQEQLVLEEQEKARLLKIQQEKQAEALMQAEREREQKIKEAQEAEKQRQELAKAKIEQEKREKENIVSKPIVKTEEKPKENTAQKKLNQVVTQKVYRKGNKTIVELTIVDGGITTEYRRVTADWGGKYFFKDDVSITERDYLELTKKYTDGRQSK